MRFALKEPQFSTHRFKKLYIMALSMIALLAIIGQAVVQYALYQQTGDALVINLAGRLRMNSQRMCKASAALLIPSDPLGHPAHIQEIRDALPKWTAIHDGFLYGNDQMGLSGHNSDAVTRLLTSVEPNYQAMKGAFTHILTVYDQDQSVEKTPTNSELTPDVDTILAQEPAYLTGVDNTVTQLQHESEEKVARLKIIEITLLILTLTTLTLESFLVFRPAVQKLNKSYTALVEAEEQLSVYVSELERKNSELELAFSEAMAAHRKVMPHARVIAFGRYQVQGSHGSYYNVASHEFEGTLMLECECPMYRRNLICSHSLAAATLHSALLRQPRNGFMKKAPNSSFNISGNIGSGSLDGEMGGD
jgi:hypothetical protein